MNDKENIDRLFENAMKHLGHAAQTGTKEVFGSLVEITLKYRDELAAKGEKPIVVSEVEEALNIFQKTIQTGAFPKNVPARIVPLLERWILALSSKQKKQ